jgi:hypothetical protein
VFVCVSLGIEEDLVMMKEPVPQFGKPLLDGIRGP